MFACGIAVVDDVLLVGIRIFFCEWCESGSYTDNGGNCRPSATHLTYHTDRYGNRELDPFVI